MIDMKTTYRGFDLTCEMVVVMPRDNEINMIAIRIVDGFALVDGTSESMRSVKAGMQELMLEVDDFLALTDEERKEMYDIT
jgi:hypothetical protein